MKKQSSSYVLPLIVIFVVLLIDQASKIWIKTHMEISEEIPVFGDWFIIHFTENNGMAFGVELPWEFGKLALSLFRIFAVGVIGWYLFTLPKKGATKGLMFSGALVFAGALGNIIDSAFYGLIFNESHYQVASFMPEGGGYASFLHGRVVDMLYFPLWEGYLPEWLGGDYFIFFRPVFNIADSAISVGVASILLFHRNFFKD
ncbi:MAG: lipoprotein signal peptidase [Bacteroidetes bacterium]|nr:MAG: lipoprotein signal peptidase [Bacteroidota bacterium]MBL1143772.1 lipoprotein signal peptidase [Bacteroidota bacterium]MCB0802622.1 lipoprotein signal peptidase [Flavobacteriales bacterium]NOG56573.1 lipoprotein signal peptidase [Bacteroidota bacterium]